MRKDRKEAKNRVKSIRTLKEYEEYMNALMLTDEQRRICDLMFVKGRTYIQIGEEIGCSEAAVKWKVSRILDKLV